MLHNRHYENLPNGWGEIPLVEICWLDDGNQIDGEKLVYWDAKALRGKNTKVTLSRGKVVEQGKSVILVDGENSGEVFTIPYRGYLGSTFKILQIAPLTDKNFVRIILDYNRDLFRENKTGSAIPHLNKRLFKSMNVLLPPLLEQERIAKSVDLLFTQIDIIEQNQAEIENLYDELKKRTLDLAIQGKLVPQDPSDEPASVLLEKIRAEKKAQLGKKYVDSYIYKGDDNRYYEKVGSETKNITEEVPFDIPETWEWTRLSNVCEYIHRGKSPVYGATKKLPIIAQKCNQWDRIYTEKCLFAEESTIKKYTQEQFLLIGDIIINSTGTGTVGRTGYVEQYIFQEYSNFVADSHVTVVRANHLIFAKYLYLFLKSPQIQTDIEFLCSGSTNQIELAISTIRTFLIPPFQEQVHIVELYEVLIDKLKDEV